MAMRWLVSLLACLTLTGCAEPLAGAGPGGSPSTSAERSVGGSPSAPAGLNAVRLIGLWSVDAPGVDDGVVLRLDPNELLVFGTCGVLFGQWQANVRGDFLASTDSSSGSCTPDVTTPPWLAAATGFGFDGAAAMLVDETDTPTARLQPGAVPSVPPNLDPSYADPSVVTDEDRRRFAADPSLPAGLTPAVTERLIGRWLPVGAPTSTAFVSFADNRSWTGSDGCNGIGGRWLIGSAGALLATSGPQTLIGCLNIAIADWLFAAALAGFDGEIMVLVGADGNETGRLQAG